MNEPIMVEENQLAPSASLDTRDAEIEEMMEAGVHLGHAKTKNHPAMQPYIFGVRNTISIIDLTKTREKLAAALEFIKKTVARGGMVLLVGTRPAAKKIIREVAERTGMPYFNKRWIGGALTNFKMISKRVEYMEQLEKERAEGEFEKYTKKERAKKEKELMRLKENFDGIILMKQLPDVVFIVDINEDATAVREARRMKIPTVALCDTNSNADLIDYPIPSNDDALPAVRYMMGKIAQAIEEGQKEARERELALEEKKE